MDVGVIGIGAVGMLIASELATDHEVTCYVRRTDQKKLINDCGVVSEGKPVHVKCRLIEELKQHDLMIICVKQTHLDDVLSHIKKLKSRSVLMFLQNGLGHLNKIKHLNHDVLVGVIEHGVLKISDNEFKRTGSGVIRFSSLDDQDAVAEKLILSQIHKASFPVYKSDKLIEILYEKLVINSVINPLTALFDTRNGQVIQNEYLKKVAYKLTKEASEVLSLDPLRMWKRVQEVALQTKENYSSMAIDLKKGRMTEIDYINGYLLRQSEVMPTHLLIYELVKGKESLKTC